MVSQWKGEGNANDSVGSNTGTLVNGTTFAGDEGRYTGERLSNPFEDKQRVLEAFLADTSMNFERSVGV